jgi:D-sedoheptulose 7-phosphate isomerase
VATPDELTSRFEASADVIRAAGSCLAGPMSAGAEMIIESLRAGGAVYVFGNGGSASDAQHIAGELVGRFLLDRQGLRAEALTTDTAAITAIANDFGYDQVFARQLSAKARPGDVAWGLSTSGNSPNVVAALALAREKGVKTLAMTGRGGGACASLADVLLAVESDHTPRIQEAHVVIYHTICELVEAALA